MKRSNQKNNNQGVGGGRKLLKSGVPAAEAQAYVVKRMEDAINSGIRPNISQYKKEAGYSDSYSNSGEFQTHRSFRDNLESKLASKDYVQMLRDFCIARKISIKHESAQLSDEALVGWLEGIGGSVLSITKKNGRKKIVYSRPDHIMRSKGMVMVSRMMGDFRKNKKKYLPISAYNLK